MQHRRALADAQDGAHLPGGLAFHGPAQGFQFTRRERRPLDRWCHRRQQAHGRILGMHRKQLQVGHQPRQFAAVRRQRLVTLHTEGEVPPLGQVQRHRNAGVVPEARLLLPQFAHALAGVGFLVPDDGHGVAAAVLHDRIPPDARGVLRHRGKACRRVVDRDELGPTHAEIDHGHRRDGVETQVLREAHHLAQEVVTTARFAHRGESAGQHAEDSAGAGTRSQAPALQGFTCFHLLTLAENCRTEQTQRR